MNSDVSPKNAKKIDAALDGAFSAMDRAFDVMSASFKKVFDPKLWR